MPHPTITLLANNLGGYRLRFEGGTLTAEWQRSLRPGRDAWCEMTISNDGHGLVYSFGGEVWPSAWPALFDVPENLARGSTLLTSLGLSLVAAVVASAGVAHAP